MWIRADQLRDGDPMIVRWGSVSRTVNVRAVWGRHDGMIVTEDFDGVRRVFAPDAAIDVD